MDAQLIEGKALPYILVTPEGFTPGDSYPLVFLMHGFGANMYDLVSLSTAIDDTGYVYAFPNAPYTVDLGGGYGYSWSLGRPGVQPPANPSPLSVDEMLSDVLADAMEKARAAPGNVVIGGFSQGGGMTLTYGLPRPETFAGAAILSGLSRDPDGLRASLPAKRNMSVFMVHGTQDSMIRIEDARKTRELLESEGYKPEYHEYNMGHEIPINVIRDLIPWLHATLPAKS